MKQLARFDAHRGQIRTSGTVAVCKFNKLILLSPKALLKGYDWQDTAAHEYTHLVLTRRSRNEAPIWLQEGLAKWFEDDWRGGDEPLSPVSAALVKDAVQKGALVTFDEMHPSLAKLPSQERAALAYAEVVLAVERMVLKAARTCSGSCSTSSRRKDAKDAVSSTLDPLRALPRGLAAPHGVGRSRAAATTRRASSASGTIRAGRQLGGMGGDPGRQGAPGFARLGG